MPISNRYKRHDLNYKRDLFDYCIYLNKKIGDSVAPGESVAVIYGNGKCEDVALEMIRKAYKYTKEEVNKKNIIIKVVR